eukprot:6881871-Ditylum_brightwellii.AAC.1
MKGGASLSVTKLTVDAAVGEDDVALEYQVYTKRGGAFQHMFRWSSSTLFSLSGEESSMLSIPSLSTSLNPHIASAVFSAGSV